MKKYLVLMMMALATAGLTACEEESTKTETVESAVVDGTEVEKKTTTEVTIDDDGNRTRETHSVTTVDPEGILNKETTEEIHTEETTE